MNYRTFFSRQAQKPTGIFGRYFMSRIFEKGNAELNTLVKDALCMEENCRALEIGFGTGMLLKAIADELDECLLQGVDFSKSMIDLAGKKNQKHIKSGKVKIQVGNFDELPFEDDLFDRVFSVNTIYFWKDPQAAIAKISRILKPGGRVALGFAAKKDLENHPLDKEVFQFYSTEDVEKLLSVDGGFRNVEVKSKLGSGKPCHCAVGVK